MPSLTLLQQLSRLDKLSPRFPSQLGKLLHGQRYRDCVNNLQEADSLSLVEYLDDVSPKILFLNSPPKPT
jgi:hypothetical protein